MLKILRDKIVTTRIEHKCNACGRIFKKGTKMHTQVNVFDSHIQTWRECSTCQKLLDKYHIMFEDDYDYICHESCVTEILKHGETPEDLLYTLELNEINKTYQNGKEKQKIKHTD